MCFYNAERFIRAAVRSVFAQSFDDWELLFVDDGSRDGGRKIVQEMMRLRPDRVRILQHPECENRGISASRNLALQEARGCYVAFLDADDVWLPEKLERQVALLEAHPEVAMTYGPSELWYGWTGRPSDARRDQWMPTLVESGTVLKSPDLLTLYLDSGGSAVPGICSLLVRRKAALEVGGFDNRFRGLFEDQVFFARICLQHAVLVTDDQTTRYRQHDASCCADGLTRGDYDPCLPNPARRRYLVWLRELVTKQGCTDSALWKALRRELRPYAHPQLTWLWTLVPRLRASSKRALKQLVRRILPAPFPRWIKARLRRRAYVPPTGWVRFGDLRRPQPMSRIFGYDRGQPVDRHYIERFLDAHAEDIRGRTLEAGDDSYTRRFGGERTRQRDVLHPDPDAPGATLVADLATAVQLPANAFDCVVLTQTLQLIYDLPAAIANLHRMLKPGGVLLVTVPGMSQLSEDQWRDTWCWGFTPFSAQRLFASSFGADAIAVESHGNVLAATAFLHGIAADELSYPLLITVRAVKNNPTATLGPDEGKVAA
jgi:hypothetical protein